MIDIHCHILPGVDDGAKDMAEALAMARLAAADGIRHIVVTPHFNTTFMVPRTLVEQKLKELQKKIDQAGIPLKLHPGNEVRLENADFFYEHAKRENFCYLNSKHSFILLEQKWKGYNRDSLSVMQWLLDRGTTMIIPHPERHPFFRENPELLTNLIQAGAWTQVSVDSLLGKNSDEAKAFAEWLVNQDYAHTLATDAHNTRRKPNLSRGFEIVEHMAGAQRVKEIQERMNSILGI